MLENGGMPPSAVRVVLRDGDRERLMALTRASTAPAGLVQRARIVLLAADGVSNTEIAVRLQVARQTVVTWRKRYVDGGMAALEDADRPGRPVVHDDVKVVVATLEPPPEGLGVTHWSSRLLADHLGISFATITRIWRKWNLQPWRVQTFKFSTDPELEAKIRDVVGLYLNPPQNAVVVCIDEKSQVQALDRTAPILPLRPGIPQKQTHDYVRHGTTTLFAALEVATGKVTDRCYDRHTNTEFLAFLKIVAKAYPRVKLHVVCDNYATHKHPNVKAWLAKNPRVTLHFTPTSGSWLNMVEIFFGIITRQAIRRGTHHSVADLIHAIETFIDGWNDRCQPFVWTKPADDIIAKAVRPTTSNSRH
jgi:transposase